MEAEVEAVVVGAGVVGLAIARALAQGGREVVVLEKNLRVGEESSSRNSGVIHSGIYYPPQSLKAELCVRGRDLLYAYCVEKDIAHQRLGKIIVAQSHEVEALRALQARALRNGVTDLQWLSSGDVLALEPEVRCEAALLSPSTGIIDVHELLLALWADLEAAGGTVVFNSELLSASRVSGPFTTTIRMGQETTGLTCHWLINSAGLDAPALAASVREYPKPLHKSVRYAKGNYFSCSTRNAFRRLVYPMPNQYGLGVHATLDLSGAIRFGPDVEWVDVRDYDVNPSRASLFYESIRTYWPTIPEGSLQPAYAGIRPKLLGGPEPLDFVIEDERIHGVPGLINLMGIESPGLTSSLALGERIQALVGGMKSSAEPLGRN